MAELGEVGGGGARVEVWSGLHDRWVGGFRIVEVGPAGTVWVRRDGDTAALPQPLPVAHVRQAS